MSAHRTRPEDLPGRELKPGELPSLPKDIFRCELLHIWISADICCRRPLWFKPGTPENLYPYCTKKCPLGRQVRKAMPKDYKPKPPPWAFRGRPAPKGRRDPLDDL